MTEAWLALLQFADGLFPAGGFAHSFGLETYAQDGAVSDRAGLEAFVTAHLEGCGRAGRRGGCRPRRRGWRRVTTSPGGSRSTRGWTP